MKPDDFKEHAQIAKALAHASRMFIVATLLKKGDQCVGDLVDMIGSDQSTVSKHLAVLKNIGILEDRREGSKVMYHLITPCIYRFFECAEGVRKSRRSRMR